MVTDDQLNAYADRFVQAFEKIADSLESASETYRQRFRRQFPEIKEVREAIITRVPSPEDRIREAQGATAQPLSDWLSDIEQEEEGHEDIGVRERQWLEAKASIPDAAAPEGKPDAEDEPDAGPKAESEEGTGGAATPEGLPGGGGGVRGDHPTVEEG